MMRDTNVVTMTMAGGPANSNARPHLLTELHGRQIECATKIEQAVRRLADIEEQHNRRVYDGMLRDEHRDGDSLDDLRDHEAAGLGLPLLIEIEHATVACFETVRSLYVLARHLSSPVILARHIRECLIPDDRGLLTQAETRDASIDLARALLAYCREEANDARDRDVRAALARFNDLTSSLPHLN